jgi:hypothetical protein
MFSIKKISYYTALGVIIMSQAVWAKTINTKAPLLVIPKLSQSPKIDGSLNDPSWAAAAQIANFHGVKNGINMVTGTEQTILKIGYTDAGLFLGCKMVDAALLPVNQLRHEFLKRSGDGYLHHQRDDSLSILLLPLNSKNFDLKKSLFFAINGNGYSAIKAEPYYGNYFKFRDKWTRPKIIIRSKITDKGYWNLEVFIPFESIKQPIPKIGTEWLVNFTRFHPRLQERVHWAAGNGAIDKVPECLVQLTADDFGHIIFGATKTAVARIQRFENSDFMCKKLPFTIITPTAGSCNWTLQLKNSTGKLQSCTGAFELKPGKNNIEAAINIVPESKKIQYNLSVAVAGNLIYRSGWRKQRVESATALIKLVADTTPTIYWNGKLLTGTPTAINGKKLQLLNAANVIAVKSTNHTKLDLTLVSAGFPIRLNSSWKYSTRQHKDWQTINFDDSDWRPLPIVNGVINVQGGNNDIFIRKTVLNNTTAIFPKFNENSWHINAGATDIIIWTGQGVPAWNLKRPLKDFKLFFDLPKGLTMVGVGNVTKCKTSPDGPAILRGRRLEFTSRKGRTFTSDGQSFQRYIIELKNPVTISQKFYAKTMEFICMGLRFGIKAAAELKPGTSLPIRISSSAFGGNFEEFPSMINCHILPKLNGSLSKRLNFVLMEPQYLCLLDNENMKKAYLKTIKQAGINMIFAGMTTDAAKQVGLNQTYFFNFWTNSVKRGYHGLSAVDVPDFIKKYPEATGISFTGKTAPTICPVYLAKNHNNIWQAVEKSFVEMLKRCPGLNIIFWDFEFPLWSSRGTYTGFSPFGIKTFADKYQLKQPLTPAIIKAKYSTQWREFMQGNFAEICRRLQLLCQKYNIKVSTWTGYEHHPSIDCGFSLAKNNPYVDISFCGYGRSSKNLNLTRKVVGKKMNSGILDSRSITAWAPPVAMLVQRTLDSRNGFHLWLEGGMDGAGLSNIAKASQPLVKYEALIIDGKMIQVEAPQGVDKGSFYSFVNDNELLIAVVNNAGIAKDVSFKLPEKFAKLPMTEFYSKKQFSTNVIKCNIAPFSAVFFYGKVK